MPPEVERGQIHEAIRLHTLATGERPLGWYTGRCSLNTVDLVSEEGGFAYVSDTYDDDLPYWRAHKGHAQLIIPYSLATNDMRFVTASGFANGEEYFQMLKDTFDCLYAEGEAGTPKMMSLGLHCRLVGMPGRFEGLKKFVDYIKGKDKVWIATRIDIAEHWASDASLRGAGARSRRSSARHEFIDRFGSIFEHSPWIAERAWDGELGPVNDTATGLHFALRTQFRGIDRGGAAGRAARPPRPRRKARGRQAADRGLDRRAGLGRARRADRRRARALHPPQQLPMSQKFGFPFIIAVRDNTKASILAAFEARLGNSAITEFQTACAQVERIAYLRLKALLGD